MHGKKTDQRRKQRADAAAEIVAEPLAGAAHLGGKEFGQKRSHSRKIARGEKPKRKAEPKHSLVWYRQFHVKQDDKHGPRRKNHKQCPPADPIGKPRADKIARESTGNEKREISRGPHNTQSASRGQKLRKPSGDGIITALRAGSCGSGEDRCAQNIGSENAPDRSIASFRRG